MSSRLPLVWDFYRQITDTNKLGGINHYFDTKAQRIYLNNGVKTKTSTITDGHWKTSTESEEIVLNEDNYSSMSMDSTTKNEFHMVGVINSELFYLRYNGKVLLNVNDFINL